MDLWPCRISKMSEMRQSAAKPREGQLTSTENKLLEAPEVKQAPPQVTSAQTEGRQKTGFVPGAVPD